MSKRIPHFPQAKLSNVVVASDTRHFAKTKIASETVSKVDEILPVGAVKKSETMSTTVTQELPQVKINYGGGKLEERWFVYYNFKYKGSITKRFKEYGNVNRCKTLPEKYEAIIKLQTEIQERLANGYNPFDAAIERKIEDQKRNVISNKLLSAHIEHSRYLRHKSGTCYESYLNIFITWLENKKLNRHANLSLQDANDFLNYLQDEKHLSNTTRNSYLIALRMYFKLADLTPNPFDGIKKLSQFRQGKLPFSYEQRKKILLHAQQHDGQLYLAIQILFYCMVRPNELRNLRIEHFDFENWFIRIPGEFSKNKKTQVVEIPPPLRDYLKEIKLFNYPQKYFVFSHNKKSGSVRLSRDNISKRHKTMLEKLGFPASYSFYSWKHTGNIELIKNGVSLKAVQLQNRHHDLNTLDIYLREMGAYRNDEINQKHTTII